jgi:hypothetical protein
MGEFQKDDRLELVYENGQPSHYKERLQSTGTPSVSETSPSYMHRPERFNGVLRGYSAPIQASPQE